MQTKIIIVGAGAAGLFCGALLGQKGFDVTIIDNGKKIGRKILMSGGGKCNFTNLYIEPNNYLSLNPHFCKSALKRFTNWQFIELVQQYNISYHEKELGQLFCDDSAKDIVNMLLCECKKGHVKFQMQTALEGIEKDHNQFFLRTSNGGLTCDKVIIATGGLSMPALGTSPIGYKIAEHFNIPVVPIRAGLVPFTLHKAQLDELSTLSGMTIQAEVSTAQSTFKGSMLFTHRGLSGPPILQISNYWFAGEPLVINIIPDINLDSLLEKNRQLTLRNCLSQILPKRLIDVLLNLKLIPDCSVKQLSHQQQNQLYAALTEWKIIPSGTEGYRTAEITLGGVSTQAISSKSMEVVSVPNLYFIGEVIDVTGWLGGYNFQWAWSSAFACASEMSIND